VLAHEGCGLRTDLNQRRVGTPCSRII
jgi:hypothetical protein